MKVRVEAFWDDEAEVWVASSTSVSGLVTEASTIEDLQRRLAVMVPDLFADGHPGPFEIELTAHSSQTVAA